VPKGIPDLSTIFDTIPVTNIGGIKDINVNVTINHTRVSTLNLSLIGPDGTIIDLSSDNGGSGSDFINTTFDDEAAISIKNGTAPFTGSYKPEQQLSIFDVKELTGNWILMIQDDAVSQYGTLQDWCITVNYFDLSVSTDEVKTQELKILGQNFPNPVTGFTNFPFTISLPGQIQIDLYDIYGRKISGITSGFYESGFHIVQADLSGLASGTYFYRLVHENQVETQVLMIAR
jgi:subtilisin-like proprotein convertase family protein